MLSYNTISRLFMHSDKLYIFESITLDISDKCMLFSKYSKHIIILLYANLRHLPQKSLSNSLFLRESNCAREPSLSYLDCLQFSGQRFGKTLPAVFSGKLLTNIAICDSLYTLSAEYRCSPITVFSENRVAASKMQ